jgi:hypothetical protein
MATHKTFFGKLFGWVGDIFHNGADKLWSELTPEEQAALKQGSGIVAIINAHLKDVPTVIEDAIKTEFPEIDFTTLETEIVTIAKDLNLTLPTLDFTGAITAIQAYLSSKVGTKWEWASSALAELITVALSPTTLFQKVSVLMEYVYNTFFKK